MKLIDFLQATDLASKTEIEKVKFLAYFLLKSQSQVEFTVVDISSQFVLAHFAKPNASRLKRNISDSRIFVKSSNNSFKLHQKQIAALDKELALLEFKSEEIEHLESILPSSLFVAVNRQYIVKYCKQINASYENNIFDGCAVLMRRLIEILLITAYEAIGKENDIKFQDSYEKLSTIINKTRSNNILKLSKDTINCIDDFRELGNFSAHRLHYNCRQVEIDKEKKNFRLAVEELLYKANLL